MTEDDVHAAALRTFDQWADEQRYSTFGRSPLRRAWVVAFTLGAELAKPKKRKRTEADK